MSNQYGENFDSLWLYEPKPRYEKSLYGDNIYSQYSITTSSNTLMRDLYTKQLPGEILPKLKKEKPKMGSYDNNGGYQKSSQELIDDAVREAIEKPRREAEIAKRVALVTALEGVKDSPVGTVVTFAKKNGAKEAGLYAALKTSDDRWSVTGDGRYTNGQSFGWSDLLTHLTTGPDLAENIQVAGEFSPVGADA